MALPDRTAVSRREYLKAAVAVGGTAGLAACMEELGTEADAEIPHGDPSVLPERQHAWNAVLKTDDDGNDVPPKHHVLRYLDLADGVDPADAREPLESTLTALESAIRWVPDGLLFTLGYSPTYFSRFDESLASSVDLPEPTQLTPLEDGLALDETDLLIHLASDRPEVLLAAEEALFDDRETINEIEIPSLSGILEPATEGRRTGFVGAGLAAEKQDVAGISGDSPVPEAAPFFMGYRSGFARTQATEDRVTIDDGPFAGGTTQHVSKIELQLNAWYNQEDEFQRVAKTFSPRHAAEGLVEGVGDNLTDDSKIVPEDVADLVDSARRDGVVGHAQKAAAAREDGEPILLRRDFNTTDDNKAGVHFLSLQETISDFVAVREAMTGEEIADGSGVGPRLNNGILQYLFVRRRGNFLVPPRKCRSMPTPAGTTADGQ